MPARAPWNRSVHDRALVIDAASMRAIAARELPGARFRRHLFWRHPLVWIRPATGR